MDQINLTGTQAVAGLICLGAVLYALVECVKAALGEQVTSGARWARWAPLLAPLLGALISPLIGNGWRVEGVPLPLLAHVLAGVLAGWMSGGLYSTFAQTLMGRDRRIEGGGRHGDD
jgi:hypothetical protein